MKKILLGVTAVAFLAFGAVSIAMATSGPETAVEMTTNDGGDKDKKKKKKKTKKGTKCCKPSSCGAGGNTSATNEGGC